MQDSVYGIALRASILVCSVLLATASGRAQESHWIELTGSADFDAWQPPLGTWYVAGGARTDPNQPGKLIGDPGTGVIINGPIGKTRNLATRREFGDLEMHLEFLIPAHSNAGVKFMGLYEIQILDSFGKKELSGEDCGGIYPRAELLPRYHHTDHGRPPRVNACKPPGQWQALDVTFRAPRFDAQGKKTANAKFAKVVLNGAIVHENAEVTTPTGHYWRLPETPVGTLFLQADHGPVAFRNVRVRPL